MAKILHVDSILYSNKFHMIHLKIETVWINLEGIMLSKIEIWFYLYIKSKRPKKTHIYEKGWWVKISKVCIYIL